MTYQGTIEFAIIPSEKKSPGTPNIIQYTYIYKCIGSRYVYILHIRGYTILFYTYYALYTYDDISGSTAQYQHE